MLPNCWLFGAWRFFPSIIFLRFHVEFKTKSMIFMVLKFNSWNCWETGTRQRALFLLFVYIFSRFNLVMNIRQKIIERAKKIFCRFLSTNAWKTDKFAFCRQMKKPDKMLIPTHNRTSSLPNLELSSQNQSEHRTSEP